MSIAIQGTAGSFHHAALRRIYPTNTPDIVPCATFRDVFDAVAADTAQAGLVAVENNLYGSINEVYRLFAEHDVWVTHEIRLHIQQCLVAIDTTTLDELRARGDNVHVLSQAPALAQVNQWLMANLPDAIREETPDTAGSVERIVRLGNPDLLAVAGEEAAALYGGTVIAHDINDDPGNYTRFMLFGKGKTSPPGATACSFILQTGHQPGALYRALGVLSDLGINLTKLDSHPVPGDAQHYAFYIDADQPFESAAMAAATSQLTEQGCRVRPLGSYIRVA